MSDESLAAQQFSVTRLKMRSTRTSVLILAGVLMPSLSIGAQATSVSGMMGIRVGVHGDTMWFERDTTRQVLIIKSDTGTSITYRNDSLLTKQVYIVLGDSARLIDYVDHTGRGHQKVGDVVPTQAVTTIRTVVQLMMQSGDPRAKMRDVLANMPSEVASQMPQLEPDPFPAQPVEYRISNERTIVQHRDTVRDIRSCDARRDTTTYLLFGSDSVRRLTPSPRTFGSLMNAAVVGDVDLGFSLQLVAAQSAAGVPAMPTLPNFCGKR